MIGDAAVAAVVDALARVVEEFGAPAVARCGHRLEHLEMVTEEQAGRLGAWGVLASMQPNFDALWGGEDGMYAQRLGPDRAGSLNPFALLASQGVPLAFGSDSPVTGMNPWATVRAATQHRTPGSALSARAAFAAATRGAWRAAGVRDGVTGTLVPGAPATYAVWEADDFEVSAPADAVQRWSTDRRSRVPALPRLDDALPRCRADGSPRCRHPWLTTSSLPSDDAKLAPDTPVFAAVLRLRRAGMLDRLPQLSVAIVAGLALCLSFPPFGWWYLAFVAFGLLSWVLTRESTTVAGGFGYGFLFGLVFYLPLLPWISGFVGAIPVDRSFGAGGAVPRGVRRFGGRGPAAAGVAALVRRAVGGRRSGSSRRCLSVDSLGVSWLSARPTGRCCRWPRSAAHRYCRSL